MRSPSSSGLSSASSTVTVMTGANGRAYTKAQVSIDASVLKARDAGGRGAHYCILGLLGPRADNTEIKKVYRGLGCHTPMRRSRPWD